MSCVGNCDAKDQSCHARRSRNTQARTLQVSIVKEKRKKKKRTKKKKKKKKETQEGGTPRRASNHQMRSCFPRSPPMNGSCVGAACEWQSVAPPQINEP